MDKISSFVMGASIGCAFGALAALALAPRSGAETRGLVAQGAGELAEDAMDFGAGLSYIAQGAVRNARKKGEEALKGAGTSDDENTADELKAKIDAVREKIIANVSEGA